MPRTATATAYTYIDCPTCGQGIAEPFWLGTGPTPFVHGHGNNQCRIWVYPEKQYAARIPDDTSMEKAGSVLRKRWTMSLPLVPQRHVA